MVAQVEGTEGIKFTVDLEDWYSALHIWPNKGEEMIRENTEYILKQLDKYHVKAHFYVLGMLAEERPKLIKEIASLGHKIGSHGFIHWHNEKEGDKGDLACRELLKELGITCEGYRSPYWEHTAMPGWSGGFFFRVLPYNILVKNIMKSGTFWVHPHDIALNHSRLTNPWLNWKRHINLKGARVKLERLLQELPWQ